jgi:hypothetical protein
MSDDGIETLPSTRIRHFHSIDPWPTRVADGFCSCYCRISRAMRRQLRWELRITASLVYDFIGGPPVRTAGDGHGGLSIITPARSGFSFYRISAVLIFGSAVPMFGPGVAPTFQLTVRIVLRHTTVMLCYQSCFPAGLFSTP